MKPQPALGRDRTVLITGTSTGIGYATALALDLAGWRVFAGVRTDADASRLRAAFSPRSLPILLDVTSPAQIVEARMLVESESGGRLDALVNNAGIVYHGPLEMLSDRALREQFDVNVFGLVALTRELLPLVRAAKGRIVNVGSISGRTTPGFNGIYAASKYAVVALTDALRIELAPLGVLVMLIEPGVFRTAVWSKPTPLAYRDGARLETDVRAHYERIFTIIDATMEKLGRTSPRCDPVVEAIRDALESRQPKLRYLIGADAVIQLVVERFIPMTWRVAILRTATRLFIRMGR